MPSLLRKITGRIDIAQRLGPAVIPGQRKSLESYIPPPEARLLTREEREHIDWLIRALTS